MARTLFDKVWDRHVVATMHDEYHLLYVDRHLLHDGSFEAFNEIRRRGLRVRRPDLCFGTPDHFTPSTFVRPQDIAGSHEREHVLQLARNAREIGFAYFGLEDPRQGIVHLVGPEQGISLPGSTIVCGDSHTSTHGAMGALAFGIGTSEATQVLATQCLWQKKPKAMRISMEGRLPHGVCAKDLVLALIGRIGTAGAVGHVIEFAGSAVRDLSVEGRLTMCNMSIEAGARAGMVAPDEVTFQYLRGRPYAPAGPEWERALESWKALATEPGARFDREISFGVEGLQPMVTWGTSPEQVEAIDGCVPDPREARDPTRRRNMEQALDYMALTPGTLLEDVPVDRVFIGSCTNSRIEDLREAASVMRGRTAKVPTWVVPGSQQVQAQAEAEGLDRIFKDAGIEWRRPGCSMCVGINGDTGRPGERIASTTNRNFAGRQGPEVRTHLMSPSMAAAASITGRLTDVRRLTSAGV